MMWNKCAYRTQWRVANKYTCQLVAVVVSDPLGVWEASRERALCHVWMNQSTRNTMNQKYIGGGEMQTKSDILVCVKH